MLCYYQFDVTGCSCGSQWYDDPKESTMTIKFESHLSPKILKLFLYWVCDRTCMDFCSCKFVSHN